MNVRAGDVETGGFLQAQVQPELLSGTLFQQKHQKTEGPESFGRHVF